MFCVVKSLIRRLLLRKTILLTQYVSIGDTVYVVTATEKEGAKETPLDIMRRLIDRKTDNLINEERTCYLRANGGKK